MKRIIRHDGPKSTDRGLAVEKLRQSKVGISDLSAAEARAIHVTDFHDSEYEYSINHWLSKRALSLLDELSELGIYGESSAEVGARFVDQALNEFVERNMGAPMMTPKEREVIMSRDMTHVELLELQLPEIDFHNGRFEETINNLLSNQSLCLLDRIAEVGIYGETSGEVGARFVDQALQAFVQRPRFIVSRIGQSRS